MIYDDFCKSKECEFYIEWEYRYHIEAQPSACVSCKLIGNSHNIEEYPKDCPFLDKIKLYRTGGIE